MNQRCPSVPLGAINELFMYSMILINRDVDLNVYDSCVVIKKCRLLTQPKSPYPSITHRAQTTNSEQTTTPARHRTARAEYPNHVMSSSAASIYSG